MKLISLEKFRSENKSSILDLKKASEIFGGYEPADSSNYTETENTASPTPGDSDCQDRVYNDAGGLILTGGIYN